MAQAPSNGADRASDARLAAVLYVRASVGGDAGSPAASDRDVVQRAWVVVSDAVRRHEGAVFETGSSDLVAVFATAVDAVAAAVDVQRAMRERRSRLPNLRRATLAMGVHLGEITYRERQARGPGREVATALAESAAPGAIRVSVIVYEQARRVLEAKFEDAGEFPLRSGGPAEQVYEIRGAEPEADVVPERVWWRWLAAAVAAFVVVVAGVAGGVRLMSYRDNVRGQLALRSAARTLVVSSLEPASADADDAEAAGALTRLLLDRLGVVLSAGAKGGPIDPLVAPAARGGGGRDADSTGAPWRVVFYREGSKSIPDVSRELAADAVLSGSIKRDGKALQVSLTLVDHDGARPSWSHTYDVAEPSKRASFAHQAARDVRDQLLAKS